MTEPAGNDFILGRRMQRGDRIEPTALCGALDILGGGVFLHAETGSMVEAGTHKSASADRAGGSGTLRGEMARLRSKLRAREHAPSEIDREGD